MTATLAPRRRPQGEQDAISSRRLTERVFRFRESGIIAVLALFVLVTSLVQPRFASASNIQFVLVNTAVYALVALGETMVIITRNVDLSVQSVLALSAFLSANLFGQVHGIPIPVAFLVGIGIGLACGAANGLVVSLARVPSLVVTLATLYIFQGIDILVVGSQVVVASSLPSGFVAIPNATLLRIPWLAIGAAAVIGLGAYYLRSFRSGRELYAIGSNPEGARLAGIPVARRVFAAFTVCGGLAGLGGVLWAAEYQTINSSAGGTNFSLIVIASAVVGGVAIFGGSGSVIGAAVGALLLGTINVALDVLGISDFWDQAIAGFLLLLAIAIDRGITVRLAAALRKRSARDEA